MHLAAFSVNIVQISAAQFLESLPPVRIRPVSGRVVANHWTPPRRVWVAKPSISAWVDSKYRLIPPKRCPGTSRWCRVQVVNRQPVMGSPNSNTTFPFAARCTAIHPTKQHRLPSSTENPGIRPMAARLDSANPPAEGLRTTPTRPLGAVHSGVGWLRLV